MTALQGTAWAEGDLLTASAEVTLPTDPARKVRYGSNPGGWVNLESMAEAFARMRAAFGNIAFMRCWPSNFNTQWRNGLVRDYIYDTGCGLYVNLGSDVAGALTGKYDAALRQLVLNAPTDRFVALSFAHEPENDGFSVSDWGRAQVRLGAVKADAGRPDVKWAPLLMGATYHPQRYRWNTNGRPWTEWFDFDLTNVDALGTDIYQAGTTDASADHAAEPVNPSIAAARAVGKHLIVGELGTRSVLSDFKRAEFLTEAVAIFNANADIVDGVAEYESSAGAKGPWNLLPKPGTNVPNHPLAVAVWRAAVASSST